MGELFLSAFVTFFVVIDPIGVTPIFASLTSGSSATHRRVMAIKSVAISFVVLIGFGYGGEWLFTRLAVTLDAFRIAGGILLFMLALDMLFETRTERRENRAETLMEKEQDAPEPVDISVFPMAIPMLAGPGAIASIMLFLGENTQGLAGQTWIWAAVAANLSVALILFLFAGRVIAIMGDTVAAMITRILGVVLSALSAQFIIDGVTNILRGL